MNGRSIQRLLVSPELRRGFLILGTADVSIGRSKGCHVVLRAGDISRVHARITSRDGKAHALTDLGSRNGTWVNGERVATTRLLRPLDEIAIGGSIAIIYREMEGTREELAARFSREHETGVLRIPPEFDPPLLAGTISSDLLIQMCQLLELNGHTGVIRVECEGLAGILRFRDGLVVGARFGSETGHDAARRILAQRCGRYVFDEKVSEAETHVNGIAVRSTALALDVMRLRDELTRGGERRALAAS